MRRVTLRSLWAHKRRLVSTVLSIVLGVAFMSGTFVFADTLDKVFDDLFSQVSEGTDTRVQGEVLFSSGQGMGDQRARFDEAVLGTVREVDGVVAAAPYVEAIGFGAQNRVLDDEGDPIGADMGPPTLFQSWIGDEQLSPYELTEGSRGPETDGELALNVAAAEEGEFELGDRVTVATQFGNVEYTLVGTFTFGDAESAAGAVSTQFTLAEAQRLAGAEGQLDSVVVAGADDVSEDELTARVAAVIPDGTEAVTGKEAARQDAEAVQDGFQLFRVALSIFGGIALLVAVFIIANTFQILVAQRTRELALLRAVGASRSQVLRSVLLEATAVGLVAAVLGLLAGIALAVGITAILDAFGADLPSGGLVVSPDTIGIGLVLGIVVTVVAAIAPAIRATRVPPLAALRDVAFEHPGASQLRAILGVALLLLAGFNLSKAFGNGGDTDVIPTVGLGALLLVVGAIVVGPLLAGPTVRLLGAIVPRLRGVTGRLAVENAARAPKRTSATASALLIGVALIGFITVFAASAKKSVSAEVERGFAGDLVVQASGGLFAFSPFSPEVVHAIEGVDGVEVVAGFGADESQVTYPDGDTAVSFVGAVDPAVYGQVARPELIEGSFDDLQPGTILVDRQAAEDNDLSVGDAVTLTFPRGARLELTISGISDDLVVLAPWTLHAADFATVSDEDVVFQAFASVEDGRDVDEVQAAVEEAISPFPSVEVLDRGEWAGDLAANLTAFVNVIYGLLALSIVIALIGVANTLSLSVHERTRELGLLRAVGMARSQLRSAIRWEAVLIAALGTVVGLGLGLVASYSVIKAMEGFGLKHFDVPVVALAVWAAVFALFGVLASLRTAHRASKLDILQAIATE